MVQVLQVLIMCCLRHGCPIWHLFSRIEKCLVHFVVLVMMNKCTKFHKNLIYHLWEISLNAKVNLRWDGERTNKTEKLYALTKLVGHKNEIQFIITLLYVIIHSNIFQVRRYQMIINNCIWSFSLPLGRNHSLLGETR